MEHRWPTTRKASDGASASGPTAYGALAAHILETKETKFDPRKFKDEYENALKKMVRRKAKGHTLEAPNETEKSDNVIDLMDALRQSLATRRRSARRQPRRAKSRRTKKAA